MRNSEEYSDIMNLSYPLKKADIRKHPRMTIRDRAKIFAPFAALKGYDDAILAKQKIVVPKIELSEETKAYLDEQLFQIEEALQERKHPMITVVYFEKDKGSEEEEGEYIRFTGMVAKLHTTSRILQIVEKKLLLDDIYHIEIF